MSDRADDAVLHALRTGDAEAFARVVNDWSPAMIGRARAYVSTRASAEDVVQDTWLAVIRGLDRFEARSTLRTWVFRILVNIAKTRGVREARVVPVASMDPDAEAGPTIDPARFRGPDDPWPRHWLDEGAPHHWHTGTEDAAQAAISREVQDLVAAALEALPPRQREVVSLRDVHDLTSDEVCETLGLSAANQRVLLHRGRAKVRAALENYYHGTSERRQP
ncbi:MAG TPA: sigma-70 family RNA polymerase sigma factor [Kineosporiaceae bacterium]|nr:sigma-70 family RNA polymerase sigma factor [Kineosporiaceae bacterium]